MASEQKERFSSIRQLVDQADEAFGTLRTIARDGLSDVDNDSAHQAENLQMIQHAAGAVVERLQEITEVARESRSFQAQEHQAHSGNRPQ